MSYSENKQIGGLTQLTSAADNDKLAIEDADETTILKYIAASNLKTYMNAGFTASRALETDGSGKIVVSAITATELNHLSGVASNIGSHMTGKDGVYHLPDQAGHGGEFLTTDASVASWTALTGLIGPTDIQDFAVTMSKLFTKIPVIDNDSWSDNTPGTGYIQWNTHNLCYNGEYYEVTSDSTNQEFVWWTVGNSGGSGTVADPYITTYSAGDTAPTMTDDTFIICTNKDGNGTHNLAWNSIANSVIGTAYIKSGAIINAHIADATIEHAKIKSVDAGTITVGKLGDDYISSASTWNAKAKVFRQDTEPSSGMSAGDIWIDTSDGDKPYTYTGSVWNPEYTHIDGGNITTGTITAITHQTASNGQRIVVDASDNTLRFHTDTAEDVVIIDDLLYGNIPGIQIGESTHGGIFVATNGNVETYMSHDTIQMGGKEGSPAQFRVLHDSVTKTIVDAAGINVMDGIVYASDEISTSGFVQANAGYRIGDTEIIDSNKNITTNIGTVDGIKISDHAANADAHHNEVHTLNSHSDVDTTGISDGEVLEYDTAMGWIAGSTYTPGSHVGAGGAAHADVTTTVDGFMTATDKVKLNSIDTGADVTADNWPKVHGNTYHTSNYQTAANVDAKILTHKNDANAHHAAHSGVSGWLGGQDVRFENGLAVEFGT